MTKTEKQMISHLIYKRINELEKESYDIQTNEYIDVYYREASYSFIRKEIDKYKALFNKWVK